MPTDLERRLLDTLVEDMDEGELRRLIMHIAETHLEVVGAGALRIKEDNRKNKVDTALSIGISTPRRKVLLSESPVDESTSLFPRMEIKLMHR